MKYRDKFITSETMHEKLEIGMGIHINFEGLIIDHVYKVSGFVDDVIIVTNEDGEYSVIDPERCDIQVVRGRGIKMKKPELEDWEHEQEMQNECYYEALAKYWEVMYFRSIGLLSTCNEYSNSTNEDIMKLLDD